MGYFKVIAKCGHVGRNNYILKEFYIEASSGKEAAKLIRDTPRVKHNQKDAIRGVLSISPEDYYQNKKAMNEDPYFKVHSKQEQELLCPKLYELTFKEEEKRTFSKKGGFRHVKHETLLKETLKEMKGEY